MTENESTQQLVSPSEPASGQPMSGATPPVLPPRPPAKSTSGRRNWLIAAVVAVILVIASSAVTYYFATDQAPAATQDNPQAGASNQPGENNDDNAAAQSIVPGEEPIADAADKILPSVVQIQSQSGVGSGVVYDADGLILTAAHVVAGQDTVTVRFEDGEEVQGTVVGGTTGQDVAVVRVDRTGLPAAELALDGKARVGQLAIAVGSPWGLQGSVSAGIISAVDQPVDGNAMLQTDAAINPGNSGGALVDRDGRVLGINVSIFTLSGANDGVGFAVPISLAYDIAQRVVSGQSLDAAYLGVTGSDVESGQAGALVTGVSEGGAADAAGIQVGDLVTSIDGVQVQGIADLAAQVRSHRPGAEVEIVIVRNGQESTVVATLAERPDDLG